MLSLRIPEISATAVDDLADKRVYADNAGGIQVLSD